MFAKIAAHLKNISPASCAVGEIFYEVCEISYLTAVK